MGKIYAWVVEEGLAEGARRRGRRGQISVKKLVAVVSLWKAAASSIVLR